MIIIVKWLFSLCPSYRIALLETYFLAFKAFDLFIKSLDRLGPSSLFAVHSEESKIKLFVVIESCVFFMLQRNLRFEMY